MLLARRNHPIDHLEQLADLAAVAFTAIPLIWRVAVTAHTEAIHDPTRVSHDPCDSCAPRDERDLELLLDGTAKGSNLAFNLIVAVFDRAYGLGVSWRDLFHQCLFTSALRHFIDERTYCWFVVRSEDNSRSADLLQEVHETIHDVLNHTLVANNHKTA